MWSLTIVEMPNDVNTATKNILNFKRTLRNHTKSSLEKYFTKVIW